MTNFRISKSSGILLFAAAIWGFAFVAQRAGMEHVGPYTFNSIRFALGTLFLLPFIPILKFRNIELVTESPWHLRAGGFLSGIVLFAGASFQQVGIVYTTAGNAGFITSLYILIVPFLGLIIGQKISVQTWIGVLLALPGLYFLSVHEKYYPAPGDGLVLASTVFFAVHVMIIGWFTRKTNPIKLSVIQFFTCSVLSGIVALVKEEISFKPINEAIIPLIYGGVFSVGIAFTLQVVGQRNVKPAHAAMILSLESVFAVLGGWILLEEEFTLRKLAGCGLMLSGILISLTKNSSDHTNIKP